MSSAAGTAARAKKPSDAASQISVASVR
jgi:hypothetical protein